MDDYWCGVDVHSLCDFHHCSRGRPLSEVHASIRQPVWMADHEAANMIDVALNAADEKLARDVVVLDVTEFIDAFDTLIIGSGRNDRQVRAIAEEIERLVTQQCNIRPLRVEGLDSAQWVAIDYGFVIVHIFDEETREYYDLEHLWSAAGSYRRVHRTMSGA